MTNFDPNTMSDKNPKNRKVGDYTWATYIPTRRPKFKVHATRGHATSACKCTEVFSSGIPDSTVLYKWVDSAWVVVPIDHSPDVKGSIILREPMNTVSLPSDLDKRIADGLAALKAVCRAGHKGPGGARVCICGAGCGGTAACNGLYYIKAALQEPDSVIGETVRRLFL